MLNTSTRRARHEGGERGSGGGSNMLCTSLRQDSIYQVKSRALAGRGLGV